MSHQVKVVFPLDPDSWHRTLREAIWAERIGEDRARLCNVPFLAEGVSFHDVVFVREEAGELHFNGVSIHSGHSTFRLKLDPTVSREALEAYCRPLAKLGCRFEASSNSLWAVDAPPDCELKKVRAALKAGDADGVWELEIGHLAKEAGPGALPSRPKRD